MIYFSFWSFYFSHHQFKVIDQGFHIVVNLLFWWQIKPRYISIKNTFWFILNFLQGLLYDTHRLPHLFITYHETIVNVPIRTYRHFKIKLFVATIRVLDPNIIVDTCSTKQRA